MTGCGARASGAAELADKNHLQAKAGGLLKIGVELARAKQRSITARAEFTGSLLPNRGTPIVTEVDGVVESFADLGPLIEGTVNGQHYSAKLGIQPGQEVKAGEILVQLDRTEFELEVAVAAARLQKAQADLANLMAWEREESIDRLQAALDEAEARKKLAAAEHQRALTLSSQSAASRGEVERAQMELSAAGAMVATARASLREAQAGPTREAIAVSQALVSQAEAELKQAHRRLEKTAIRAPYDGALTEISVFTGQHVSPASGPLFELLDLHYVAAEVGIPEAYIGKIQMQDVGQVLIAGSTEPVPGVVISINDKVDPESRSYRVRVGIDNARASSKRDNLRQFLCKLPVPMRQSSSPRWRFSLTKDSRAFSSIATRWSNGSQCESACPINTTLKFSQDWQLAIWSWLTIPICSATASAWKFGTQRFCV